MSASDSDPPEPEAGLARPRSLDLEKTKRRSRDCSTLTDLAAAPDLPEVEIVSLVEEQLPRYKLRADYLTEFKSQGVDNDDQWVVRTPALRTEDTDLASLTPEQAEATLGYFVACGDRLTQMTKTYHDVEAVTRLLEEKERDLELAAHIGQELLQRNKESDEKVARLETDLCGANDVITQLRHELQVKTDLLHVYTNDVEDASPLELRSFNVELLQKKINDLEEENKHLHDEASQLAHEATKCEEKEEKLVKDAVQHLTQANIQIKDLHHQFTHKVDESSRQREEINGLLSQVCDLQKRVQKYSHENDDLTANLRVYQETQDELTSELLDLKEKYREVVDLLRDANEEIRRGRKRTYPGAGKHSVPSIFSTQPSQKGNDSLQAELYSSVKPQQPRPDSKLGSEISDSDTDLTSAMGSSAYRKASRTLRAIARTSTGNGKPVPAPGSSADTSLAAGESLFQSYTISRENSFSPDCEDFEFFARQENKLRDDPDFSDDSGTGRSTGLGSSLSSSAPREEVAREMLRLATRNSRNRSSHRNSSDLQNSSGVSSQSPAASRPSEVPRSGPVEVVEVQTVGQLKPPTFQLSSTLLQSTPLGQVPSQPQEPASITGLPHPVSRGRPASAPTTPGHYDPGLPGFQTPASTRGHPGLGVIPGRTFSALRIPELLRREGSDFDETEPLEPLTITSSSSAARGHPGLGDFETKSLSSAPLCYGASANSLTALNQDFDETEPVQGLTVSSNTGALGGHPGLGTVPSIGGHPGLGTVPSMGGHGTVPSMGGHPGLGTVPSIGGHGSVPSMGGHPGLGSVPSMGGHPGLGTIPSMGGHPEIGNISSIGGHPGLGSMPGQFSSTSLNFDTASCYSMDDYSFDEEFNISNSIPTSKLSRGEKSKYVDSGIISGDYSEELQRTNLDIDALSDGGMADMATMPGILVPGTSDANGDIMTTGGHRSKQPSDPLSVELESTLRHLNPAEVERRRQLMGRNYSYDLGSEAGLDSPGAIAGCEEYFRNLPYGVNVDPRSSGASDSFTKSRNSQESLSFRTRRLPDKLRIVKPLEGSLTLHNWSRLATPHLGGVLEERCGVAIKGNDKAGLDPLFDMYRLEEEEEEEDDMKIPAAAQQPTNTNFTFTNSTVMHPDTFGGLTSFYSRTQMSSGLPSRNQSRMSSRCSSMTDLSGRMPEELFSNLGLVRLLSEKKISCARRSQLDLSAMSAISSLTPSVLNSPLASRRMSPTCTPPHTPDESLPGSPDDKMADAGYVSSFFSSLKAAIYGQQRKEHRTSKFKRKMEVKRGQLGIMEAVAEVETSTEKEGTPMSLPPLSSVDDNAKKTRAKSSSGPSQWSDFDALYVGVLDDYDELEEIQPGLLTLTQATQEDRDPVEYTREWIGQLSVPSLSATGRPSLQKTEFGKIPALADPGLATVPSGLCSFGGRGPGRIVSPGGQKPGLGRPARPGTGALGEALGSQRKDLGTIPGQLESPADDGDMTLHPERSVSGSGIPQSASFIGNIANMLMGRKGGY